MSRRIRAFKRWMRSAGIDASDALQLVESPSGEKGIWVRAACKLSDSDVVAAIPKGACLTVKTSGAGAIIEEAGLSGPVGLSVALMYERGLGPTSLWHGYLQLLPEFECVPIVWEPEEVDSLLAGTELYMTVTEEKALLWGDWKQYIEPLTLSWPSKFDPKHFGVEQYFSAKTLIASRSFAIDDYHGSGMVPLADLFNHKTGEENVHFTAVFTPSVSDDEGNGAVSDGVEDDHPSSVNDSETLEMIVVREVEAGTEVFNTYGLMGNAALLHRYGFTEPGNPFDTVTINLSLALQWCSSTFSSRYFRSRQSLWRRLNFSGFISGNTEYFEVSFDGEPQLELLAFLYIALLPEAAYEELNYKADSLKGGLEAEKFTNLVNLSRKFIEVPEVFAKGLPLLTERVGHALGSLADLREDLYGSASLEEEMAKLKECCPIKERNLFHSLVLRTSERRILEKMRTYYSRCTKSIIS